MGEERGLVIVFTGNGKGKTSAALGMALRAWGNNLKVLILQFIKGQLCGEHLAIGKINTGIEIRPLGQGFINFNSDEFPKHQEAARKALIEAEAAMAGGYNLIILDEILYALKYSLLETAEVLRVISRKPEKIHLVLTGRDAPDEITSVADMVTEMKEIKHHYKNRVAAQKGIEY